MRVLSLPSRLLRETSVYRRQSASTVPAKQDRYAPVVCLSLLETHHPAARVYSTGDPGLADLLLATEGIFDAGVDRLGYRAVRLYHLGTGTRHAHLLGPEPLRLGRKVFAAYGNGIARSPRWT